MSNTEDVCAESTRLSTCHRSVKTEIIHLHFFALKTVTVMNVEIFFHDSGPVLLFQMQVRCFCFKCTVLAKTDTLLGILLTETGYLWREKKLQVFSTIVLIFMLESDVCETGSCKCKLLCLSLSYTSLFIPFQHGIEQFIRYVQLVLFWLCIMYGVPLFVPSKSHLFLTFTDLCLSSAGTLSLVVWGFPLNVSGLKKASAP